MVAILDADERSGRRRYNGCCYRSCSRDIYMKIRVHYIPQEGDVIVVGQSAVVHNVLDHPSFVVSNRHPVWTSAVLKLFKNGFETHNTRYVAVSKDTSIKRQEKFFGGYGI